MPLLHAEEHLSCFNYDNGDRPNIQTITIESETSRELDITENKVVLITVGALRATYADLADIEIKKGQIFMLPMGSHATLTASEEGVTMLVIRLRGAVQLCDSYMLDRLLCEATTDYNAVHLLDVNDRMLHFIIGLETSVSDGLKCARYFELKVKELMFLFRAYYTKDQLLGFFHPLINQNYAFSNFVFLNHTKVKSVKELAALSGYSLLGFEKHFEKVFGVTAHTWLKDQKAKAIFRDICCGGQTFRDISAAHNFSSPAHFNDFCKAHFGATPGQVREQNESENCFNIGNLNRSL